MKCWTRTARQARPGVKSLLSMRIPSLILLLPFLWTTLPALSQQTTLRSQSNIVLVPVLVKSAKGEIIYGLQAGDFVVEDEGVAQSVRLDDTPDAQQISMVIAIQKGRRASYEFPRIKNLSVLLEPLFTTGQAKAALVEFDSGVKTAQDFTKDFHLIEDDIEDMKPGDNGAAILDAVFLSEKLLERAPDGSQRVLLLISETRDHGSVFRKSMDEVVSALGNKNTVVTTLSFSPSLSNILDTGRGKNKNEMNASPDLLAPIKMGAASLKKNTPRTLAAMTGGEYELFSSEKNFEARVTDFTNHLESRYQLSFQPKNPKPGLHHLRVRLKTPNGDVVLARSSYWAESKAN
jgi:VWFA-related protein